MAKKSLHTLTAVGRLPGVS